MYIYKTFLKDKKFHIQQCIEGIIKKKRIILGMKRCFNIKNLRISLVVEWLRLCAPNAGGPGP